MSNNPLIYTAVLLVTLASCQQEINELPRLQEQCRIIEGHYYGGGGMHDSAAFVYNEAGKLIKWINTDGHYDYYYSGSNIIARIYIENGGQIWYVDSVRYNADNTIAELVFYDFSGTFGSDTLHSKIVFQYQDGVVSQLRTIEYTDYGFGPETDTTYTQLTWNAAGNIEKMRFVSNGYLSFDDSVLYQYDLHPNYFKSVHPHFFLFEPAFQLQAGFETQLAYFYSRNNVVNLNVYGTWDYPVTYGLDSTNRVSSVTMGGFPYLAYKYECTR